MMILMFVVFGAATMAMFLTYSIKVNSIVNALTVFTGLKFCIEFIFEPIVYFLDLYDYDFRSIFLINLLSFCGYSAFVGGLMFTRTPDVRETAEARSPARRYDPLIIAWLLLAAAWAVYSPVIIEFRDLLTEPRRIYELTRTGYGAYTFGSALLSFLAYIVFLISSRRGAVIFYALLLGLVALKGVKGQFVVLASIFIIAKVYMDGFRFSINRSIILGALGATAMVYLFAFNYRGETQNILVTIAEYSDYNRNGSLVLQDEFLTSYDGQITYETLWIPKIPRALWPDKPKIFGEFRVSAHYFPKWFDLDQGSPSFGVGVYFADFAYWAFLFYPLTQFIGGVLLGIFLKQMILKPTAFAFVMSVYLSGNNLLALGNGFFLVEHAIIGLCLQGLIVFLLPSARRRSATDQKAASGWRSSAAESAPDPRRPSPIS